MIHLSVAGQQKRVVDSSRYIPGGWSESLGRALKMDIRNEIWLTTYVRRYPDTTAHLSKHDWLVPPKTASR